MLTVCNTARVQAGYVLLLQLFCSTVILSHSDSQLNAIVKIDVNYRWPEIDMYLDVWVMQICSLSLLV